MGFANFADLSLLTMTEEEDFLPTTTAGVLARALGALEANAGAEVVDLVEPGIREAT